MERIRVEEEKGEEDEEDEEAGSGREWNGKDMVRGEE
jgi:hypothetical protein